VESEAQEVHARAVFHNSAMKLVSQSISNARIQATNEWLSKYGGQTVDAFRVGSDTYLTEEQYAQVKKISVFICLL
jgi:hypothetical protein